MNNLEQIIFDIDYITEHLFDDYMKQIKENPNNEIYDNKSNIELFWLYMSFCFAKGSIIVSVKDYSETLFLNIFHEFKSNIYYINEAKELIIKLNSQENYLSALPAMAKFQYYYRLKERLIYMREILFNFYLKTNI
jgi:hypothetical protein